MKIFECGCGFKWNIGQETCPFHGKPLRGKGVLSGSSKECVLEAVEPSTPVDTLKEWCLKCDQKYTFGEKHVCPKDIIDRMVDKFLMWPLPASLASDECATIPGYNGRIGTNLMTATEAKQMIEYLLKKD